MNADDLVVYLRHPTDSTKDKTLNVQTANDGAKTLLVAFGGAWSATYDVEVVSNTEGKFDSDLTLHVGASVTDFQPRSGSIFGGTLITITGENFSSNPLDNPVNIAWDHCEIISSSPT